MVETAQVVLEITDANGYYPFGMNHLKTGNAFFGGSYKAYKYDGNMECMIIELDFICLTWEIASNGSAGGEVSKHKSYDVHS